MIHHRCGLDDPRVGPTGPRAVPFLGAEHRGFLLSLADEDDALLVREAAQPLGHHVILALAFAEEDEWNRVPCDETIQRRDKPPAHWVHQRGRGQRLPAMRTEEAHRPKRALQSRHIEVEIHSVDPLDRQPDVIAKDLGHTLCYHYHGSGRAVLPLAGV